MTDRQERFDLKNIKIENTVETKTPTSWMSFLKTFKNEFYGDLVIFGGCPFCVLPEILTNTTLNKR